MSNEHINAPETGHSPEVQAAWHAGIDAGREIERNNAAALQHATQGCNPSMQPIATAFFTEKGEVAYTGLFDRTLKALDAVKTTRMGISAGSIDLYAAPVAAQAPAANADARDAARYRWLRKGESDDVAVVRGLGAMDYGMSAVVYTYSEEIDGDDLDAAIDAARQGEGGAE